MIDRVAREMSRLDMVFAEQTGRAVETVDVILRDVMETLPARGTTDETAAGPALARRIAGVRQVNAVELTNAAGKVMFSSGPATDHALPLTGNLALAAHRADAVMGLRISEPMRDGDGRWTALMTRRIPAPNGGFGGIAIAYLNLAYFEDFYKAVELNENGAILLHRRDGVVLARFPRADGIIGSSFADLPPFTEVLAHSMAGTVLMTSPVDGSHRILAIRALKAFPLAVSISVDEGRVLGPWWREVWVVATAALVSGLGLAGVLLSLARRTREGALAERLRNAEELARAGTMDSLTGLMNRTELAERLAVLLAAADAQGTQVALLFLDLDGFAHVNDVHGHKIGDAVLRVVADRLARVSGTADVARWGGDEFVIVMAVNPSALGQEPDGAIALARKLLHCVSLPIDVGAQTVHIGSSIGLACYPRDATTQDGLVGAADLAMYAGKQAGGDTVWIFDPAIAQAIDDSHQLEGELRQALDDDVLTLSYQPIVEMPLERCVALEALLRWQHPTRGPIDPSEFIPMAENAGLIGRLGRWVLERACMDAATWQGDAAPGVTVNVSLAQITSGRLPEEVAAALARSGLAPGRLQLEITESMVGAEHSRIVPVLRVLREMGVGIALDDFGTGFSSLSRLRIWPIDTIKIDRSFIGAMAAGGTAVIRATLLVAEEYGLTVTAEGVETREQQLQLVQLGINRLQGYLFSRPLSSADAARWLFSRAHPDTFMAEYVGG